MRKLSAVLTGLLTSALVAGLLVPMFVGASSHRDAPLILEDPVADNTDVYAFVSTEPGHQDLVTLIANFIPLEEPGGGPNYYLLSDNVLYEIMVDTNGDAEEDLTYQFQIQTRFATGNTFLYNTGPIIGPPNPTDPASQYQNLNIMQSYTLSEVRGDRRAGTKRMLVENARVAPINVGPKSLGDAYENLAAQAVIGIPGEVTVFVGPRDEGFYVDLMGNFDLLNYRNPGVDTTSGYNVHSLALEMPKSRFQEAGDTDGRIGVWASASRNTTTVFRQNVGGVMTGDATGPLVQVSRLGNPLVNEVLIPLRLKDQYNMTHPRNDGDNFEPFIVNPEASQGGAALVPLVNSLTGCTPVNGRTDLKLALLTGIPEGVLPGFPGNQDTQSAPVSADMIRLNYNIPPSAEPNRLGLLGGDPAGFPNGRRVGDDVLDIDVKAVGGAILHVLGQINCPVSLELSDNVNGNDVPYLNRFPYLGTPHQGYNHTHDHSSLTDPAQVSQ